MKFESYEEVQQYLNHDEITCLICGVSFRFLGGHIRQAHNIHAKEYREMFNLPLHAPLAGISYRAAHREVMKENIALGLIKTDMSPEKMKEISKKGADAKALHSGATKRVYMHKPYKAKHKNRNTEQAVKRARAKAAQQMGDPSLMQEYQKEKKEEREAKRKRWETLGVLTCNEVSNMTRITPRNVRKYAILLGVKRYKGFFMKYGWTEEEIERLVTEYPNARKEGAGKQWETKRKKLKSEGSIV